MIRAFVVAAFVLGACGHDHGTRRTENERKADKLRVQRITRLSEAIDGWRLEIGLKPEQRRRGWRGVPPDGKEPPIATCEQPVEPAKQCTKVCGLAELICDNAEDICSIADELEGDDWAADQCASARISCVRAEERCCECERDYR